MLIEELFKTLFLTVKAQPKSGLMVGMGETL